MNIDSHGLEELLAELASERPVFHSEADFQHSLAWAMQVAEPGRHIRLEWRAPIDVVMHVDVLVIEPDGQRVALELKYWTRRLEVSTHGEAFALRNHGAHDISRYDFVKDISRIERLVEANLVDTGSVIAVTNDPGYWRPAMRTDTIDAAFRLGEGRVLAGELTWADHAGAGTTRGRQMPHDLSGRYRLSWNDYSTVSDGPSGRFRYVMASAEPVAPARSTAAAEPARVGSNPVSPPQSGSRLSKYSPLQAHLDARSGSSVQMTFAEIDKLVGGLPASARTHRAWWSNESEGSHVQAPAWMDAGWRVADVNLTAERVHFTRG